MADGLSGRFKSTFSVSPPLPGGRRIVGSILRLFFSCGPSAVFSGIPLIIINSFNCMAWRRFLPHILNKIGEFSPFIANGYIPATVSVIMGGIGVSASLNHRAPASILSCINPSMFSNGFKAKAPARPVVARF